MLRSGDRCVPELIALVGTSVRRNALPLLPRKSDLVPGVLEMTVDTHASSQVVGWSTCSASSQITIHFETSKTIDKARG